MHKRIAGVLPIVACALGQTASAWAAGIALDVQSARGTGMAGAMTAIDDDSSSIFYNAAGIAQGKILDVQVGDSLIMPSYKFSGAQGSASNTFGVVPPFQVYESGGVTENLSIGVGVFTPYGLTLNWPSNWVGKSLITQASFATYDFNPTIAYRWGPVRVGAGLQIVRATVDLKRKVEAGVAEMSSELGAGAWAAGANVGIQVDAAGPYLSFGAQYRSAATFNFDGDGHFGNVPPELQGTFGDQRVTTSITTPDSFQIGVASRPIEALVLDLDVVWYGWSKFRSIDITFPWTPALNVSEPKNWNDTVNVHLGGEVTLDRSWRVRAGVLYDPSPAPASTLLPDVPDADRLNLAAGGSYVHPSGFRLDLGYQYLFLFKRTSTAPQLPGDYSGFVNIVGISIGYRTPSAR
jgi:long-chain fatty acid transport protein